MESDYAYLTLQRGPVSNRHCKDRRKGDFKNESNQMDERRKHSLGNAQS